MGTQLAAYYYWGRQTEVLQMVSTPHMAPPSQPTNGGAIDITMLMAVVLAALQAQDIPEGGNGEANGSGKVDNDNKPYSNFQIAKLKGSCCMRTNANLLPTRDYFKSMKDIDAQWMQLIEEMTAWVKQHAKALFRKGHNRQ